MTSLLGPQLRLPALMLAGALLLGLGLLGWGLAVHEKQHADLVRITVLHAEAVLAAREAPVKLRVDAAEAGLHEQLRSGGFVGAEQRTAWITALGRARATLNLDSLSWRLAARTPSALAPGLHMSVMDLTAGRMDASRMESLLGELRGIAPGRFTPEHCVFALHQDGQTGQAECRLNWWTWENASARP